MDGNNACVNIRWDSEFFNQPLFPVFYSIIEYIITFPEINKIKFAICILLHNWIGTLLYLCEEIKSF